MEPIRLDSVPVRELAPGCRARFVHSRHMTFAHWRFDAGADLPAHAHPHEQVATFLEGTYELTLEGRTRRFSPGEMVVIPPHATHGGRALTDCVVLDVFYPVREDYR